MRKEKLYQKDRLMVEIATLEQVIYALRNLANELPEDAMTDAQLQGAMSPKELPPEDR